MKSTVVLAALVGFALINTAFLGAYLISESSNGGLSFGSSAQTTTAYTTQIPSSTQAALSVSAPTTSAVTDSNMSNGFNGNFGTSANSAAVSSSGPQPAFALLTLGHFFEIHSLALAPTSWFLVGGMWIWRGRMKSKWTNLGFDSDVFGLFVKMKGAKTRIRLLDSLSTPKDRLQLAQELGLDWKAVDRHVTILRKYGFVEDRVAYGKVRMYELTPMGRSLLHLLEDLSGEEKREAMPVLPPLQRQT